MSEQFPEVGEIWMNPRNPGTVYAVVRVNDGRVDYEDVVFDVIEKRWVKRRRRYLPASYDLASFRSLFVRFQVPSPEQQYPPVGLTGGYKA